MVKKTFSKYLIIIGWAQAIAWPIGHLIDFGTAAWFEGTDEIKEAHQLDYQSQLKSKIAALEYQLEHSCK